MSTGRVCGRGTVGLVILLAFYVVTGCPIADYTLFDGVCYKSFAEPKTRDEASQTCAADGGMLAIPRDSATNTFLAELPEVARGRWLGLTAGSDGQLVFEDGQVLTSSDDTSWSPGEPRGDNGACVGFVGDGSLWNIKQCSKSKPFICQTNGGQADNSAPHAGLANEVQPDATMPPGGSAETAAQGANDDSGARVATIAGSVMTSIVLAHFVLAYYDMFD